MCVRSTIDSGAILDVEGLCESFGRGADIEELEACLLDSEARDGFSMGPKAARTLIEEVAGEVVAEVSLGSLAVAVAGAGAVVLGVLNKADVVLVEGGYPSVCVGATGER